MKIFIIGLPESGRTNVAKALCQSEGYGYIHATLWVKSTFREKKIDEKPQLYHDEYHSWFTNRLLNHPQMISDNIIDSMSAYDSTINHFVIDGVVSPKDFTLLFDYNKDVVVFLNRIDNQSDYKDYENIGVSVIKDYCFWLASADLLPKTRWLEFNFHVPGEDSDFVKCLGSKNSVFIVKSINSAIKHLKETLLISY